MSVEVFPMTNIPPKVKAIVFIAIVEWQTPLLINYYNYLKKYLFAK